ncbi:TIGR03089 family protein [Brachybacterium sp. FME24]|uniref:TIGR03089 family protein n=1 Tax=Brachybacterium sp. FME24 TaxID=2742605 RepID=UPI001868208D|nr:TIGR03089 family protein [Brachybacterium sp. FME24]
MTADLSTRLLTALARSGPNPALAWYGEAARIELSGHVLANWVIKTIGHLHDEIALEPGDAVVLDLPPHWKRLVLALAAWSLGAHVTLLGENEDETGGRETGTTVPTAPRLVATDRPDSALARSADEVLAVQPVSLAPRFDGQLPALVHDWVAEVRASPDQLGVVLPAWGGPAPSLPESSLAAHDTVSASGNVIAPRLLVGGDGLASIPAVLAALLAGGGFVGPSAGVSERQAHDEAVTGPA